MADVLGGMGGMGGMGSQVRGEVEWVDDRGRQIEVRSGWGQSSRVRYDSRTEVVYRNQRYSVRDLERGDVVSMQVRRASNGESYADRIYVEESVRDRRGSGYPSSDYPSGRREVFDGRILDIDYGRGWFELDSRDGRYRVSLPYNPSRSLTDRFRRLRRGDSVRIEGERLNHERVELYRFR